MTKPKPKELHKKPGRPRKAENPGFHAEQVKEPEKNKGGRPPKLFKDDRTVKLIGQLAMCQCSITNAAGVLEVSHETFRQFLEKNPDVKEVWLQGQEKGIASLRQAQFKKALSGNPEMLKWLGKQYLNQKDKAEVANTGADGGPIAVEHSFTPEAVEQFKKVLDDFLG